MKKTRERPIEILVVDDSAVVRQFMAALLEDQSDMQVETAADPLIAIRKLQKQRPDVILLDLEMPRMDGLTFLREEVMAKDPIPVVIFSSHAGRGTELAVRALEAGAVQIRDKSKIGLGNFLEKSATTILDTLRAAADAHPLASRPPTRQTGGATASTLPAEPSLTLTSEKVVAIGASAGGTEALRQILEMLPVTIPGFVVVQHMPQFFTATFAHRLDQLCAMEVREAKDGDRVSPGVALIAPGDRHLRVVRSSSGYRVEIYDGELVCRHRPSVDVLFKSVAKTVGPNGIGILLTGMGADGADGLLEMRQAGSVTVAQDEASCVVFGMPKRAIEKGAAEHIAPPWKIAKMLLGSAGEDG